MTADPDSLAGGAGEYRDLDAPRGLWFHGRPRGMRQSLGAFVWLAFILFPAINAFARHGTALDHGLTVAAAAAFVVIYVALVLLWRHRHADPVLRSLFVGLVALACALTLSDGASWGFLFTYCAASAGLISSRFGFAGVVACSVLAGITSALGGASGGQAVGWVASSAGIGMLILVMRDLRVRNEQLSAARAELAQMAVAQERERFARDLHDLLGHSLSVIALKAELAGRMLSGRPDDDPAAEARLRDRAATEVRELEQVARVALGEVRDAVSGYRQPTLEGELAGARMALSAAGIEADVQQAQVPLAPAVEAVLAWTVREGATNVIRHSGARRCTLRVTASLTDAGVEVVDDGQVVGVGEVVDDGQVVGVGETEPGSTNGGHGIAGLAERARLVHGTIEAGALAGGGYRLAVSVPVSHA
jgi:two-component system, NarL family, sensor histidine kinase DesK